MMESDEEEFDGMARNCSMDSGIRDLREEEEEPKSRIKAFDVFGVENEANRIVEAMRNKAFARQEFEEVESTSEYAETHYYKY